MRWSKVCKAENQPHRGAHYSEISLCVKEFAVSRLDLVDEDAVQDKTAITRSRYAALAETMQEI